jgi:hypothetical protein
VAHSQLHEVVKTKAALLSAFKGKDLGETKRYLNMEVERDRKAGTLKISQPLSVEGLAAKMQLGAANSRELPVSPGMVVSAWLEGDVLLEDASKYSEVVGGLLYLSNCTRPDIAYAVNTLSRYMTKPTSRHFDLLKGIVRYLRGTMNRGLIFGRSSEPVVGFTDADYAACKDTRRSRSGMLFLSHGGAVHWASKLQSVVTLSTAEAEYVAGAHAAREAVWVGRVAVDLQLIDVPTVKLNCDNQSSLHMAHNPADTSRTKHIDIRYHFLRQCVQQGAIELKFIPTDDNVSDVFTKALPREKLTKFAADMGVL